MPAERLGVRPDGRPSSACGQPFRACQARLGIVDSAASNPASHTTGLRKTSRGPTSRKARATTIQNTPMMYLPCNANPVASPIPHHSPSRRVRVHRTSSQVTVAQQAMSIASVVTARVCTSV